MCDSLVAPSDFDRLHTLCRLTEGAPLYWYEVGSLDEESTSSGIAEPYAR